MFSALPWVPCVHHHWILPVTLWYGPQLYLLYRWLGHRELVFHVTLLWNSKALTPPQALPHSFHLQAPYLLIGSFHLQTEGNLRCVKLAEYILSILPSANFQLSLGLPKFWKTSNWPKALTQNAVHSAVTFQENMGAGAGGKGANVPPLIKFPPVMSWKVQVSMEIWASLQLFLEFLLGFLHL